MMDQAKSKYYLRTILSWKKTIKKYVLSLYYFESEKETALPMFLEVLKHIRYVSE